MEGGHELEGGPKGLHESTRLFKNGPRWTNALGRKSKKTQKSIYRSRINRDVGRLKNGRKEQKTMTWKTTNLIRAMEISDEEGLCYGRSVLDNYWYVATREELKKLGVVDINP